MHGLAIKSTRLGNEQKLSETLNKLAEEDPALVNTDPEDGGWFFKMTIADASQLEGLMDEAAYKAFVDSL